MFQHLLFKQYRRIYRYDLWMRRHFTFTGHFILILMLGAGVFGVDTHSSNTYQLFVFLAVVTVFALLGSLGMQLQVKVKRHIPKYMTVDEPSSYSVTVNNLGLKNHHALTVIDTLQAQPDNNSKLSKIFSGKKRRLWPLSFKQWRSYLTYLQGAKIAEVGLGALDQSAVTAKINITPIRRGLLTFSTCYIAKIDNLGLFRRLTAFDIKQSCLVLPKRYPVRNLNLAGGRRYQPGGVNLASSVGDSTEFVSLRDYQYGDPKHAIHWKSLAKHDKLIIKEFQDEYFARTALLLDSMEGNEFFLKFEAAVSVAASIVYSGRENDALLDLLFAGRKVYQFTSGRGIDFMPHIQEILASVQLSPEADFNLFTSTVLQHLPVCNSLICIFLHWDDKRRTFYKQLQTINIPILALVIYDSRTEPDPALPISEYGEITSIDSRNIAEGLARL